MNLLPTYSSDVFCVFDRFPKDSEFLGFHNIQLPVVNRRGVFDFWYMLIQTLRPQARDACYRDKAQAASFQDSIQSFASFTTRLRLTKESFQMEDEAGLELPHSVWDSHLPNYG